MTSVKRKVLKTARSKMVSFQTKERFKYWLLHKVRYPTIIEVHISVTRCTQTLTITVDGTCSEKNKGHQIASWATFVGN
jgi:hypothetical protein